MGDILGLKKKLNSLVNKTKPTDEGFSYICQLDGYQCVGRKKIVEYLKEKHEEKYQDLSRGFDDEAEFQSQLTKLVMTVPYANQEAKTLDKQVVQEMEVSEESDKPEEEEKDYPLTLDFMKIIDERTTKIPNYGSLNGRIARLAALLYRREKKEDGTIEIFSRKTGEAVGGPQDMYSHIQANHPQFLENLSKMVPPAMKRINEFLQRAAENFDLIVPTRELVRKLEQEECDRLARKRKEEMEERLQKAKEARAEMERKRKKDMEERQARKRKQDEEKKMTEFKVMKINPDTEGAEEIFKIKKEIQKLDRSVVTDKNRKQMKDKKTEQREKLREILVSRKEERINKRMSDCLENLSPKQLRKLCMEYLDKIDVLDEVDWVEMCRTVKIDEEFEFLTDFLGCLYEMAKFYDKKSFKVGHVLITSKQSEAIVKSGIRSVRDNISGSFVIPSSWDMDSPGPELGKSWNRRTDAQLLAGASRFGKNLLKIVEADTDTQLRSKCLDSNGAVKEAVRARFGHLVNVYITRGKPAEEFGTSLYSLDIEDGEELDHLDEEEDLTQRVGKKDAENKENKDKNVVKQSNVNRVNTQQEVEEEQEVVNLDDDDGEEVVDNKDDDEEIDESLLDETD